jgi:hypothetical protein
LEVKESDPPEPEPAVVDPKKPLWGEDYARKAHVTLRGFRICGGLSDPHLRIRKKIEEAWEKLRDFPDDICCIVLYDTSSPGPTTLRPEVVYGAMLGRVMDVIPYDPHRGFLTEESFQIFSPEGGQTRWDTGEPRKRNISAVLVLDRFPVGRYRFFATAPKSDPTLRTPERAVITYEAMKRSRGTERDVSHSRERVIVCENPSATRKLPRDIFCGTYDEWYGLRHNRIERISAGREIRKLEARHPAAFKSPLAEILKKSARKNKLLSKNH